MVPPASHGIPRAPCYSGSTSIHITLRIRDFHPLWSSFPADSSQVICIFSGSPTTPVRQANRFGLLPFRSPLLRESRLISFPPGTEMFHFPGLLPTFVGRQLIASRFPRRTSTAYSGCWDLTVAFRTQLRPFLSGYPRHPSCALKQTLSFRIYVIMLNIYPLISNSLLPVYDSGLYINNLFSFFKTFLKFFLERL